MDRRIIAIVCTTLFLVVAVSALVPVAGAARPAGVTSVTVDRSVISPDSNGIVDSTTLTVRATAGQTLYFNVYDANGGLRRTGVPMTETSTGVYVAAWDGRANGGTFVTEAGSPFVIKPTTSAQGNAADDSLSAVTVEVDLTPPTGVSVRINNDSPFTQTQNVELAIAATGCSTTTCELRAARGSEDISTVAWGAFETSKSFTTGPNDGTRTVRVEVRDLAGNSAASVTDTIVLDTTNPAGSIVINNNAATTTSTAVTLAITGSDTNGVSEMRLSNDGTTFPNGWEAFTTTKSWTLSGTGDVRVTLELKDGAGRTARFTDSITVNTGLSGQTISIAGGAQFATSDDGAVTLNLQNPQTTTYTQMSFGNSATASTLDSYEAYAGTKQWILDTPATDGLKTVFFRLRNPTTSDTETVSDTIVRDRTLPTATLSLLDAAALPITVTNQNGVLVAMGGADSNGVNGGRASRSAATLGAEAFTAIPTSNTVWCFVDNSPLAPASPRTTVASCPEIADGAYTLRFQSRDTAGLISSTVERSVTKDTTPPGFTAFTITLTSGRTASTSLAYAVTATEATQIGFAIDGGAFSTWQPFAATGTITLPSTISQGDHTVSARVRDANGNIADARTASFTFDSAGPLVPTFNIVLGSLTNPSTVTSRDVVLVTPGASDAAGLGGIRAWLSTSTEPASQSAYSATFPFTLPATPGTYTVNVRVLDALGNPGVVKQQPITLATASATLALSLTNGRIGGSTVSATLGGGADAVQYAYKIDSGAFSAFAPFTTTANLALGTITDGAHTITVRVRHAGGNDVDSAAASFIYDSTVPAVTFDIVQGTLVNPASVTDRAITLRATATDDAGVANMRMRVWLSTDAEPTTSVAFVQDTAFTLPEALGEYTINMRVLDALGLQSAIATRTITLAAPSTGGGTGGGGTGGGGTGGGGTGGGTGGGGTTAPPVTSVPVATPAGTLSFSVPSRTNSRQVTITLTGSGITGIAVAEGAAPTADPTAITGLTHAFTLSDAQGPHTIFVKVRTAAGVTDLGNATIILDSVAPVTSAPADVSDWRRAGATFQLQVADAHSAPGTTTWSLDGGAAQTGTVVTIPDTLADGVHTLTFRTMDGAGNAEAERTVLVRLDRTAPATTTDQAEGMTTPGAFTIVFAPTDATSGVATVRYRIDSTDGSFSTLRAPFALQVPLSLGPGAHRIQFGAIDAAGNEEPLRTYTFTFGQPVAQPKPPAPPAPAAGTASSSATRALPGTNATLVLDGRTGVVAATIALPVGAVARDVTLNTRVVEAPTATPFADTRVFSFVEIELTDATGAAVRDATVNLRFQLSRAWLASQDLELRHVLLLHNTGGAWTAIPTRVVAQDPASLGFAGNVTFEATVSSFSPFALAGDATPPTMSSPVPADGAMLTAPVKRVSVNVSDNVRLQTYSLSVGGTPLTATLKDGVLSAPVDLGAGRHTVTARASDLVGNVEERSWTFTVSTSVVQPPTPLMPGAPSKDADGKLRVVLGTGSRVNVSGVTVDNVPVPADKVEVTEDGFRIDPSVYTAGEHTVRATYTDADGNAQTYAGTFEGTQSEPEGGGGGWIVILLIALALVGAAAYFFMRKKK